jgi:hypothetical protein
LAEFKIPAEFGNRLFEFQKAAVKIAAHHLNKRGGVLLGDVVGLGKTLMATAIARIFEDDFGTETLIRCPKNLVRMWEGARRCERPHLRPDAPRSRTGAPADGTARWSATGVPSVTRRRNHSKRLCRIARFQGSTGVGPGRAGRGREDRRSG